MVLPRYEGTRADGQPADLSTNRSAAQLTQTVKGDEAQVP